MQEEDNFDDIIQHPGSPRQSTDGQLVFEEDTSKGANPFEQEPVQRAASPVAQQQSQDNNNNDTVYKYEVRLSSPEKVVEGVMNAHIEYKLDVKTNNPNLPAGEYSAIRRYSEFAWLREQLAENYKGYLIPPLPEKTLINRFNTEFIEYRRRELERFLRRVCEHRVLSKSPQLQVFIEIRVLDTKIGQAAKKEVSKKDEKPQGATGGGVGSLLRFVGASVESVSANFTTAQSEPDQWFDAKKNYILGLETQLNALAKAINNTIRKRKELNQAYGEFGQAASLLSSCEADNDGWLSDSFNRLSEVFSIMTKLDEKLTDDETAFYEDAIRDYIRILGAVKEMLGARSEKLAAYQNATKQLETKKEKTQKNFHAGSIQERRALEDLEKKVEETKQEFNKMSDICRDELQIFEAAKGKDMRVMLVKLTRMNIDYAIQVVDQWKNYLSDLQDHE